MSVHNIIAILIVCYLTVKSSIYCTYLNSRLAYAVSNLTRPNTLTVLLKYIILISISMAHEANIWGGAT